jgi:phosphatidylethanolamine-binding protein (PEBP) family uncharacterized protein
MSESMDEKGSLLAPGSSPVRKESRPMVNSSAKKVVVENIASFFKTWVSVISLVGVIVIALFGFSFVQRPRTSFYDRSSKSSFKSNKFTLYSTEFDDGDSIPVDYTCFASDGGVSPPLKWTNAPSGTVQFMLLLSTENDDTNKGDTCTRYDWVLYDIPADTTKIKEGNSDNVGTEGGTFPNTSGVTKYYYKPPCPQGEGEKTYTYTLYALSDDLAKIAKKSNDDDYYKFAGPELLIEAEKNGIILDTASFTATITCDDDACSQKGGVKGLITNADDDGACI